MRSEWEFCTLFLHFTFFYKAKFFWKNKELGERLSNIMEKRRNLEKITKNRWENFMGKLWKCFCCRGQMLKFPYFDKKYRDIILYNQ